MSQRDDTFTAARLFEDGSRYHYTDYLLGEFISSIVGDNWADYGWDDYDSSIEIYGVPPEYRLTKEQAEKFIGAGFGIVFLNHTDGNETHYSRANLGGWRTSYTTHRGERQNQQLKAAVIQAQLAKAENAQLLKDRDVWQHKFEESQRQLREQTDALLSLVRRLAERLERCEPEIGWTEKDEQMLAEADAATEGKL